MKPKKVLFVHGGTLQKAGTETYMMSVFRHINPEKYHIDFVVFGLETGDYDQEVLDKGATIYRFPTNPIKLMKMAKSASFKQTLKDANYDIVHAHMNALNYPILYYFKKMGIPVMISHSHGTKHFVENHFLIYLKDIFKKKIKNLTSNLLACSKGAGDFLYGDAPYTIINNGVDTDLYRYNRDRRAAMRETLQLTDKQIFGHVGRFNFQKNHDFLLDVFNEIVTMNPQAHLLLVGDGELKPAIQTKITALNLNDKVSLLGVRDDIPNILQAMDHFIMPSLFEGLPFVLVEAQATGLQCFAATTIDGQSAIIEPFHFLALDCSKSWAQTILDNLDYQRTDTHAILKAKGFDVVENVLTLEHYYDALTL